MKLRLRLDIRSHRNTTAQLIKTVECPVEPRKGITLWLGDDMEPVTIGDRLEWAEKSGSVTVDVCQGTRFPFNYDGLVTSTAKDFKAAMAWAKALGFEAST
jgi:hypothetical protein